MAVTQYIGARYVPLFYTASDNSNDWEAGVIYDPLTIVTYLNQSYTSKKPVPASVGNPASNPDYWILTGGYNAQVAQIQSDYDAIKAAVTDHDVQLNGKYILLSDSYGNPTYGNVTAATAALLAERNITAIPIYSDGASFAGGTFTSRIQAQAALMTDAEKEEISKVVVLAGINDAHQSINDYDTVTTGIENFCTYVKTAFPNAEILIGYIGNTQSNSAILNGRDLQSICYALERYAQCGEFGARFLANLEYVLHDYDLISADGVHPTAAGGEEIARYAVSAIESGAADVKRQYRKTSMSDVWDTSAGVSPEISSITFPAPLYPNVSFYVYQDNGCETIQMRSRLAVLFANATTISANTTLQLGQLKCNLWQPKAQGIYPINGAMKLADDTFIECRAHLTINGKQTYLRFDQFGDNWGSQSVSVTQILFTPATWTVPTMMC